MVAIVTCYCFGLGKHLSLYNELCMVEWAWFACRKHHACTDSIPDPSILCIWTCTPKTRQDKQVKRYRLTWLACRANVVPTRRRTANNPPAGKFAPDSSGFCCNIPPDMNKRRLRSMVQTCWTWKLERSCNKESASPQELLVFLDANRRLRYNQCNEQRRLYAHGREQGQRQYGNLESLYPL